MAQATLSAQQLMPGSDGKVRPLFSDIAILEEEETRKDLPCTVTPVKPELGFDFKFHAGYNVTVPLKDLADQPGSLTMVFRVVPSGHTDQPVYLSQHVPVPEIEADARGDADLHGAFVVGEGKYHVSWLMRDRSERICSSNWDMEAALPLRDKAMPLDIAQEGVQADDQPPFRPEPPVFRTESGGGLRLKVIVHFAPQDPAAAVLAPDDVNAPLSILRSMARDPRVAALSLVVFNMPEQRVIFRQGESSAIDFAGLGKAVRTLNLGRVDARLLAQKHSGADFLGDLLTKEMSGNQNPPDAVIMVGPRAGVDDSLPPDALKQLGDVKFPVFYMNCSLDPTVNPWHDAVDAAVRAARGTEYTITHPRDVYFSWTEVAGRIVKSKFGRGAVGASGQ